MKYKIPFRLEVDYYSRDYDDRACSNSSPIYTLDEGIAEYEKAIQEKCIDDDSKCARVHLWKYRYTKGKLNPITIRKNY